MRGALVTGAGKRIGAAIARHLGAKWWHVFVHYNHSQPEAEDVAADIRAQGGAATAIGAALGNLEETAALAARCDAICPLGMLVNNASCFDYDTAATATAAELENAMRVNLFSPALLSQALYKGVEARGEEGLIINLADNKVFALNPDYFSYTLSKIGLQGMMQMHAMSFAPRVRVAGIAPGITLISGLQTEAEFQRTHDNNPMRHGCTPEQILNAVDFIMASPSFHGQTIVIDGGQVLQRLPRDIVLLDKLRAP